jgi:hypothetical protein
MSRTRHWQARVTYPWGGVLVFGVQAASQPAALLKALRIAAVPGIASHLTLTRLYGRYHPLRAVSRAARRPVASPSREEGQAPRIDEAPGVLPHAGASDRR